MKGLVYILQSAKNNSYYIGSTIDLDRRFTDHSSGLVVATRNLLPMNMVFFQEYKTIKQARQVEYRLKRFKSRKIIEQIIIDGEIKMGS